jgi:leucine dehydrogenase
LRIFTLPDYADHEQVVFASDPDAGLRAIIALHSTLRGPAIGGCRVREYDSEQDALEDVLRLSRGMTMKAAVADVPFGGGKMVVLLQPGQRKTPALMEAVGRAIETLGGRYITGEDVGSTVEDMRQIRTQTRHVLGLPVELGGSGDPSPSTALGCFAGLKAALAFQRPGAGLTGLKVAIQGLGNVGGALASLLHDAGAELHVSDVRAERVAEAASRWGANPVAADAIHASDVDVFAPCALGAVLNDRTIPALRASIVAGGANNQLADEMRHSAMLHKRGILYAPDYVINSGGMILLAQEFASQRATTVEQRINGIGATLTQIFETSRAEDVPCYLAAEAIARARLRRGERTAAPPLATVEGLG